MNAGQNVMDSVELVFFSFSLLSFVAATIYHVCLVSVPDLES